MVWLAQRAFRVGDVRVVFVCGVVSVLEKFPAPLVLVRRFGYLFGMGEI